VSEQRVSRIQAARLRAVRAKFVLGAGALAGFFAVTGVAASSHPGTAVRSTAVSTGGQDRFFESDELDQQPFGFFGSIGPSDGGQPQVQTSVS
jgi:hypothetical protein